MSLVDALKDASRPVFLFGARDARRETTRRCGRADEMNPDE